MLASLDTTDFARTVWLEDAAALVQTGSAVASQRSARITSYQPNRLTVDVADGAPGWLVLADPWYPGWVARFDGSPQAVLVYRADYLFRAVRLPPGSHTVTFVFEPASYSRGRGISLAALVLVLAVGVGSVSRAKQRWRQKR